MVASRRNDGKKPGIIWRRGYSIDEIPNHTHTIQANTFCVLDTTVKPSAGKLLGRRHNWQCLEPTLQTHGQTRRDGLVYRGAQQVHRRIEKICRIEACTSCQSAAYFKLNDNNDSSFHVPYSPSPYSLKSQESLWQTRRQMPTLRKQKIYA